MSSVNKIISCNTKEPQRRIFYLDVENLSKDDVKKFIETYTSEVIKDEQ